MSFGINAGRWCECGCALMEIEYGFEGQLVYLDSIRKISAGFHMLLSHSEPSFSYLECKADIEHMRLDLEHLEKDGIPDFEPKNHPPSEYPSFTSSPELHLKANFLQIGIKDPARTDISQVTLSEAKTIIRSVLGAIDRAVAKFGEEKTVVHVE